MNDTKNVRLSGIWEHADILLPGFFGLVIDSVYYDCPRVVFADVDIELLKGKAKAYSPPVFSSVKIYNYDREELWDALSPSIFEPMVLQIWSNSELLQPGMLALVVNSPFQDWPDVVSVDPKLRSLKKEAKRYPFPRYSSVAIYTYERKKVWDAQLPSTLGTLKKGDPFLGRLFCIKKPLV